MSGDAQLTQHLAPVDGLITRFGRDLARGVFGDHAEFRLRQRCMRAASLNTPRISSVDQASFHNSESNTLVPIYLFLTSRETLIQSALP